MGEIDFTAYKKVLADAGYDEGDFNLEIEEYTDYTPLRATHSPYALYESKFTLILTNKHSMKQKEYRAERISDWTINLEDDIKSGFFD